MIYKYILIAIIAYAMGNINPSIILGKIYKVDIRKEGSGNAGTTNTIRTIGIKAGVIVLIVDVLKAFIAVKIGFAIAGSVGAMIAFACVVLGHCFPALWGFKGGKGVAASLGAAFALNWKCALLILLVAAVMLLITKRMSVGSISAAISFPIFIAFIQPEYLYFGIVAAIFIVAMHHENIGRLIRGEEPRMSFGHRNKDKEERN